MAPAEREQAAASLRASGFNTLRHEGDYMIIDGPASDSATINRTLATNGIFAAEVTSRSQSLEEYYLELTTQS